MARDKERVRNMLAELKKTTEDMARQACDREKNDLRLRMDNLQSEVTRLKEAAVEVQAAAATAAVPPAVVEGSAPAVGPVP